MKPSGLSIISAAAGEFVEQAGQTNANNTNPSLVNI